MVKLNKNLKAIKNTDQTILLKSLLQSTTDYAIFAVNLDHKILLWNEGAKHLFGYYEHEIIHKSSHALYDPADIQSGKITGIFDVVARKGSWSGKLTAVAKIGTKFNTLFNISLCKNPKGKILGYTLIARDLTELHNVLHIMSKLKESEQLLQIKNEQLHEKIQEAQSANRMKNEFVANMSHELRTPLNGILGFSKMIFKEKVGSITPKQKDYLSNILSSANQLLLLINDLLDLAKVSSGKMEFNPEKINLPEFIKSTIDFFSDLALKKNLQLMINIDNNIQDIVIDPIKLKQILNNYISNAIKFTPSAGKININVKQNKKDFFCLEVQDTGIGIHKKDLPRLFTEFQQLSTGKAKKFSGTGLGLALTRQMVELQGGQVGVKSSINQGSTFYAILPISPHQQIANKVKKPDTKKITKPRILVIEEQSQQRDILIDALSHAGFCAKSANNINEILRGVRLLNVDAIVLDFFLSDINNWRILKALHVEKNNNQHFPILILVISLEAGNFGFRIQDFLIKPIVPENLISALESAGAGPHQAKTVLIVDDDKKILTMAKHTLSKFGYQIICTSSKKNALSITRKENIDIVIVNILMSGTDGLDFLMQYQHAKEFQHVPIIIWRAENIDEAELNHSKNMAQKIVLQNEDISKSLLSKLEKSFSSSTN